MSTFLQGGRGVSRASSLLLLLPFALACGDDPVGPGEDPLGARETLGQRIFQDESLSLEKNQSCQSCHAPEWGFRGSSEIHRGGVFQGSVAGRFGSRTPTSAAYATFAPVFHFGGPADGYLGGNFWDGRATGAVLGSPAADQAQGPFLNPVEQALSEAACVVYRVSVAPYADLWEEAWDSSLGDISFPPDADALCGQEGTTLDLSEPDRERAALAYDRIALSIAAFEASPQVNRFSSRFDGWLEGSIQLRRQERMGFMFFQGPGRCTDCHTVTGDEPLLTDFSYHNVGTPPNPENPAQVPGFVDLGLGGPSGAAPGQESWGRVRTPTLRNVDKRPSPGAVKRYMHNGAFTSLEEVVHYYNTRDVLPRCPEGEPRASWGVSCWPAPAVETNMDTRSMGDLGLTAFQEAAIVAFLRTLSDDLAP